ncbi:MAG: FAD-dependent oxidoreductase [Chloroflexota bacterium]
MKPGSDQTILEPARRVPVYGTCDVLVVGGGPAGTAAAVAAARQGADVILMERYGHLGGLSTGGLVVWIDRMTDWDGRLVVGGIGEELMDRCASQEGGLVGPPRADWGSHDPALTGYWGVRSSAHRDTVTWAPTVDPEILKFSSIDIVREGKIHLLFHAWAVAPIQEGSRVGGIIFESKEGRQALRARVTIDCTGDGDIFAAAGASFESEIDGTSIHALMSTAFRMGNVDGPRYFKFRETEPEAFNALLRQADAAGVQLRPGVLPMNDQVIVMHPKYAGYSAIKVADLTAVELRARDDMRAGLAWFRQHMPGFERAYILDTASQIGVRHSRRLAGVSRVTIDQWRADGGAHDSVGLCPGLTPAYPTLQIPYGCLVPPSIDGVLVAGRNLSCDPQSHNPLREVPECWVMGQAVGVAAAEAITANVPVQQVSVPTLQAALRKQGALIDRPGESVTVPQPIPAR